MANLYDKAGLVNIPVGYQEGFLYNIKPTDNTLAFRFNRDSAATRVNKEGLIEQVGYFGPELVNNGDFSELGSELVTNGNFNTDSDWILDTGWTIANGKASQDGTGTGNDGDIIQNASLDQTKIYKVVLDVVDYTQGTLYLDTANIDFNVNGIGTYTLTDSKFIEC